MNSKEKYIEDCAKLIDKRVAILEAEPSAHMSEVGKACDRAAIAEAKHIARMIRALVHGRYEHHPYDVARGRLGYGPKVN